MTHEERAKIMATINGWCVDEDGNFARALNCATPDVVTNIAPTDIGAWGMLCDMEGIKVPDLIDQETLDRANNQVGSSSTEGEYTQDASKLVERLENGEQVSVAEIIDRANELECSFDDRGYVYISNNGWLVTSLEADEEARELMLLRDLLDYLDGVRMGSVFIAKEARSDTDIAIGEMGGRYAPEGHLFAVDAPGSEWPRSSGFGLLK